jgi:hypothetical protein
MKTNNSEAELHQIGVKESNDDVTSPRGKIRVCAIFGNKKVFITWNRYEVNCQQTRIENCGRSINW